MHTKENILKKIFFDENYSWDNFVKLHSKSIRKIVLEDVEKFRLCGEKEAGFSMKDALKRVIRKGKRKVQKGNHEGI